jgi:2'-5' RNA ligase
MRLFIAVHFDEETRDRMLAVQDVLREQARGNFSRPENLHLTLAFLGEAEPAQVPAIQEAMGCAACAPFTLVFNTAGCFSRAHKELWWIAPETRQTERLCGLARQIRGALDERQVGFDRRPFRAHITLGREVKHHSPIVLPAFEIPARIDTVSLLESSQEKGGRVYTPLFSLTLPRALLP